MSFIDDWKEWSKAKKAISIIVVCCIGLIIIGALVGVLSPDKNTLVINSNDNANESTAPLQVRITSDTSWSGSIMADGSSSTYEGNGNDTIDLDGSSSDIVSASIQKQTSSGSLKVEILKNGEVVKDGSTSAEYGVVTVAD